MKQTPNLGLTQMETPQDGNKTFNIGSMINDPYNRIDQFAGKVQKEIGEVSAINDIAGYRYWEITESTTWTAPANLAGGRVYVLMCGGGGGPGAAGRGINGAEGGNGGGGGSGYIYSGTIPIIPGRTYSVIIGAGGKKGATVSANGTNGGNTVFGSITAEGGKGGQGGFSAEHFNGSNKGGNGGKGGDGNAGGAGGMGGSGNGAPGGTGGAGGNGGTFGGGGAGGMGGRGNSNPGGNGGAGGNGGTFGGGGGGGAGGEGYGGTGNGGLGGNGGTYGGKGGNGGNEQDGGESTGGIGVNILNSPGVPNPYLFSHDIGINPKFTFKGGNGGGFDSATGGCGYGRKPVSFGGGGYGGQENRNGGGGLATKFSNKFGKTGYIKNCGYGYGGDLYGIEDGGPGVVCLAYFVKEDQQ